MVIGGTNGLYGVAHQVLTGANLAQSLNEWTAITTNVLGTSDAFTITATSAVSSTVPQQFYLLQAQ